MSEKPKNIKRSESRHIIYELNYRVMRRPDSFMGPGCKWHPMSNLEDAWTLVDALSRPEEGNFFNMSMCDDGDWTASFTGDSGRAYGQTPQQAICYAALQAIGIKVVEKDDEG